MYDCRKIREILSTFKFEVSDDPRVTLSVMTYKWSHVMITFLVMKGDTSLKCHRIKLSLSCMDRAMFLSKLPTQFPAKKIPIHT